MDKPNKKVINASRVILAEMANSTTAEEGFVMLFAPISAYIHFAKEYKEREALNYLKKHLKVMLKEIS